MSFEIVPVRAQKRSGPFCLYEDILDSLSGQEIHDGDIIVLSSKYVANSQGRVLELSHTVPSESADRISARYRIDPRMAEIILRESDSIFGGIGGFVLASSEGILAPNAGIDRSNVGQGKVILYPDESYAAAERIRRRFFLEKSIHVGIIIIDSRLMPARTGTVGIAIACAGFEPVQDMRGQRDLEGNPLKVTIKATADSIASIANHRMGEGNESTPIAIVRNSGAKITDRRIHPSETIVPAEMCVYIRGLQGV